MSRFQLANQTLSLFLSLPVNRTATPYQPIRLGVDELTILDEVLLQETFLLEAALLQHSGRSSVGREDVGGDFAQAQVVDGVLIDCLHCKGHDPSAPERLRQPVVDLGTMGSVETRPFKANTADQLVGLVANRPIHVEMEGIALLELLCGRIDFRDQFREVN